MVYMAGTRKRQFQGFLLIIENDTNQLLEEREHENTWAYRIRSETGSDVVDCEPPPMIAKGTRKERETDLNVWDTAYTKRLKAYRLVLLDGSHGTAQRRWSSQTVPR